jgi:TrmH family RNA methyltransferase
MKRLSSPANPSYREWLRLVEQPRQVRLQRRTLAEGIHLCEAVLAAEHPVDAVIVRAGAGTAARAALVDRFAARAVPLYELAATLYDRLGLVEHGVGIAAVLRIPDERTTALSADAVYLDGLQDPGNVGALLRVAAAADVRHVLASPRTAALWAPKVVRAAQGAHLHLDLREQVPAERLAAQRLHWIGTDVAAPPTLWEAELPRGPIGWVLGAEGQGASMSALAACSARVRIPLAAGVESLNVVSAAAVCLFERRRRLLQAPR